MSVVNYVTEGESRWATSPSRRVRVLLIRPPGDALPIATLLKSKGIALSHYPLFKPHFFPIPPLGNPQALIITSKNSIRALEGYEDLKKIPLYAIGDKTAELAKEKGFVNVFNAAGTSQDLIKLIVKTGQKDKRILWHLSGEEVKGNIIEALTLAGFEARRQIVYRIEDVMDLPSSLYAELTNNSISHIIFCSPRTTAAFITLLKKNKLEKSACKMISLCLSQDVGEQALDLKWKKVWISPKPNLNDLLGYFDDER